MVENMNRNIFFKKTLVFVIITLFFCVSITPCINAFIYNNKNGKNNIIEETNDVNLNTLNSLEGYDVASLTFYTFDKTGRKQNNIELSSDAAMEIKNVFDELEYKIMYDPKSVETQDLKNSFINLIDEYGLISEKQSKDDVLLLLNPGWLKQINNSNSLRVRNPLTNNLIRPFFGSNFGASVFCSVSSAGAGLLMPLFMLPRPRAVGVWFSSDAVTSAANLFTGKGFLAGGVQSGLLLGFMGVGLTYAVPGVTVYGFIGYSLFAGVTAELMEFFPPNNAPVISNENPLDNAVDVPVSLSELSFRIDDADGDLMSYSVNTDPDIGSSQGQSKKNGIYKVSVNDLESKTKYNWTVAVFDGKDTVERTFSFNTVAVEPVVSNPVPSDGQKEVPLSLAYLSFTLKDFQVDSMDYTVETSPDIGSGSGQGVGDGTYSVSVSNLVLGTFYRWFVNVTDGTHWTREVFVFETMYPVQFDPFDFGWQYRKQITINHDMVSGDFVNFPVLISIIDSDLRDRAQYDGDDILFMGSDGVSQPLNHEIEYYDGGTGKLIVWVNVTLVSAENDTLFFMYYGNKDCLSKQDVVNTWDSDYLCVLHMNGASWDAIDDSTINDNDVISQSGSPTYHATGKVGYAVDFDNSDALLFSSTVRNTAPMTMEVIVKTDVTTSYHYAICNGGETGFSCGFYLNIESGSYFSLAIRLVKSINNAVMIPMGSPLTDEWYYFALSWDGTNNAIGRKNDNTYLKTPYNEIFGSARNMRISGSTTKEYFWDGIIDEVRISKINRSSEWIETIYNTINDPSNFFSAGPEESPP